MIFEVRKDEFRAKIQDIEEAPTDREFEYLQKL